MKTLKSILLETVLTCGALAFWAALLPAAALALPFVALWENTSAAFARETSPAATASRRSPATA